VETVPDPNFSLIELPTQFKARKHTGRADFRDQGLFDLFNAKGPGCIRHIFVGYKPFGDYLRIRIFVDNDTLPHVDMDLNAFFGVLLNLDPRSTEYRTDGAGIKVLPESGYNCYLPIPFQTSCRITLENTAPNRVQLYSQIDWQQYPADTEITPFRFHAVHRKETPAAASLGGTFQIADIGGRGFVAGLFKAIRQRDTSDLIYHTGGAVCLIDGETDPHAIRGYNEEDDFGFIWAYRPYRGRWTGCSYVDITDSDSGEDATEFAAYRFYGPDPIPFQSSLIIYCGSRADDTESVLYFYKTLRSELPLPEAPLSWQVTGPFRCHTFDEFKKAEVPEDTHVWPENWHQDDRTLPTLTVTSKRTWVDLTWEYRGRRQLWNDYATEFTEKSSPVQNNEKPVAVSAYARAMLRSTVERKVNLHFAFDDWFTLWVNGKKIDTRQHDHGFEAASFAVDLRPGENEIQVKLSNFDNQEYRLWAFSCAVV